MTLSPAGTPRSKTAAAVGPSNRELTVIEPARSQPALNLTNVWQARELIYFLAWRDVRVRYRQTAVGVSWAIIQPLASMIVYTMVFGHFAHLPSDGVPYPLFVLAGLMPWNVFAYDVSQASNSLLINSRLISRVYFDRLSLPIAEVLTGVPDFCVAFVLLLGLMAYYHAGIRVQILCLPLLLLWAVVVALAMGLWLAALNVRYRDVAFLLPFLLQLWLFTSPVIYSMKLIPGNIAVVYALNPMAGVIDGFRWALFGASRGLTTALPPSIAVTILALVGGLYYFRRVEDTFADVV